MQHDPSSRPEDTPERSEFLARIEKLYAAMNRQGHWDAVFIIDRVNQYYFSSTMQEGVLVLKRDGSVCFFARKSCERARLESVVPVYPMVSYREVSEIIGSGLDTVFLETETVTYGLLERIRRYINIRDIRPVQGIIGDIRAIKSQYELSCMVEAGKNHNLVLRTIIPELLREGMSEAELTGKIYESMMRLGHQGVNRFAMFQTESVLGQLGFGENSIYPSCFNGPGGMKGDSPAVPAIGSRARLLKKGDLVFIDIGFGVNGYHTDSTQIYMFGQNPPAEMAEIHNKCLQIQKDTAALLRPGNVPAEIYDSIISKLEPEFLENFMGVGNERVKFLGHGIGLQVDETPVIAGGFNQPIMENMVISLEPKKSVPGFGILGVEDTFIIGRDSAVCITGGQREIIVV